MTGKESNQTEQIPLWSGGNRSEVYAKSIFQFGLKLFSSLWY